MQDNDYQNLLTKVRRLIEGGNLDAAKSVCSQFCAKHTHQANGWLLLGWVCSESGAYGEALSSYRNAIKVEPGCADAFLNMGTINQHWNDLPAALDCYHRALELQPDSVAAQYNIGLIHERQGKFDAALESFQKARLINPARNEPTLAKAAVYERMGNAEAALALLLPLIDGGLKSVKAGVTFSRICRDTEQRQHAIEYLELMSRDKLSRKDRIDLHFTLGRLYDRSGDYDAAFKNYQIGNVTHGSEYFNTTDTRYMDALTSVCSKEAFESLPKPETRSNVPLFIVGMPRSGTSLVEQILASHPDAVGGGELPDIMRIASAINQHFGLRGDAPAPISKLTSELVDRYADDYLSVINRISGSALHVTDKMPHNYLQLGLIKALFPAAKIIHCVRNPIDTCLSCYFQHFAGTAMPCSYDLVNMGQHYNHYRSVMDYWKDTIGISMHEIRYEELVSDQNAVTRRLIEYCDLNWDDACMDFHDAAHVTRTASYSQVRQALYSNSVERWKKYERHISPLKRVLDTPT